jgi:hypothetical protein
VFTRQAFVNWASDGKAVNNKTVKYSKSERIVFLCKTRSKEYVPLSLILAISRQCDWLQKKTDSFKQLTRRHLQDKTGEGMQQNQIAWA